MIVLRTLAGLGLVVLSGVLWLISLLPETRYDEAR